MDDIQKAKNFLMWLSLSFDELKMPDSMTSEMFNRQLVNIENLLFELKSRRIKTPETENWDSLAD